MDHIQDFADNAGIFGDGGILHLRISGFQHVFLPVAPVDVGAGVAVAGIRQRLGAGEVLQAGAGDGRAFDAQIVQLRRVIFVGNLQLGGVQLDIHPADVVDQIHKLIEVHIGIVGDVHAVVLVDGFDRQIGFAVCPGVGQLGAAVTVHLHIGIPRQRGHLDFVVRPVDGDDNHGVRPPHIVVLPGVQTEQGNIGDILAEFDIGIDAGAAADFAGAVDPVKERRDHRHNGDRQRRQHRRRDDSDADCQLLFGQLFLAARCPQTHRLRLLCRTGCAASGTKRFIFAEIFSAFVAMHIIIPSL